MTSLTDELEQNRRWKPRPGYQNARWFDELAENEFLSIGEQSRREQHALTQTVRSALACVPYYQTLFARLGLSADDVRAREDLSKLPVLTKVELFEHYHQLRANPLPAGERVAGHTRSSGTTGRPVTVALSDTATFMFAVLWHRAARWFRLDPQLTFAEIRLPSQLSSNQHRTPLGKGETAAWSAWRYLGKFFETGPHLGFSTANSPADQVAWLRAQQPAYLWGYPDRMEAATLAFPNEKICPSLQVVISGGTQMSRLMAERIRAGFGTNAHQVYGLNEIGRVAVRCPSGRYHTHRETCLVEILDNEGMPVPPGARGRIVVTALQNFVMPLIRYDTGDLAWAVDGQCACGCTLPGFGDISGRFRRYGGLPEGSQARFHALRDAMEAMPLAWVGTLRDYQIHQRRDQHIEVRYVGETPLSNQFFRQIDQHWRSVFGPQEPSLTFVRMRELPVAPSGKPYLLSSDFYPEGDDA